MAVIPEAGSAQRSGVCAPLGFRSGAAAAGVRGDGDADRLDVALLCSDPPASAAGLFTRNSVKAAPVVISQLSLRRGTPVAAVVVNSGNANACTGSQGLRDALRMCSLAAEALALEPSEVLVCSTGVIGRPLPMDRVAAGIAAASRLQDENGEMFARAILTTDTREKRAAVRCRCDGNEYTVGGVAKGAGMLHPNLATLLAFLTTDATVPPDLLHDLLRDAADDTFNCVSVDGDTSTNDTVLLLANGAAGGPQCTRESALYASLAAALREVCEQLAEQLVADAEGATRHFRVLVAGAESEAEARTVARTVAASPLVKTAVHGGDPNWGRILAAMGRSGARFALDQCAVSIAGTCVFRRGAPCEVELGAVSAALRGPSVDIAIDLGAGEAQGRAWGCDLGPGYVRINAEYTT